MAMSIPVQYLASFLTLSLGGFANALYLVIRHRKKQPLVCPLDHDCSVVTESRWAHVFGVRNDTVGALFFLSAFGAVLLSFFLPALASTLFLAVFWASLGALLFSLVLISIQFFVIKDYCFYCLVSGVITLFLFLNSILLL